MRAGQKKIYVTIFLQTKFSLTKIWARFLNKDFEAWGEKKYVPVHVKQKIIFLGLNCGFIRKHEMALSNL